MTQLAWNQTCTVGVRAMDDQHGILLDTLNEIRLAVLRGCGREQLSELLTEFTQFSLMHFHNEEHLMEQGGVPGLDEHRTEHQHIMRTLRESLHRVQHDESVQMHPLLCGMRDLFLHHVEGLDQSYGEWLNERGIF